MKSKMKLMPLLVSVTLISGCTVLPGSNMSTMGKDVIKQQDADFDLDKMVNVYPLTPRLIDQLRLTVEHTIRLSSGSANRRSFACV